MSIPFHWSDATDDGGISFTTPPRGIRNANKRESGIRDSPDSARFRLDFSSFLAETFSLFLQNLGDSFWESRDSSLCFFDSYESAKTLTSDSTDLPRTLRSKFKAIRLLLKSHLWTGQRLQYAWNDWGTEPICVLRRPDIWPMEYELLPEAFHHFKRRRPLYHWICPRRSRV